MMRCFLIVLSLLLTPSFVLLVAAPRAEAKRARAVVRLAIKHAKGRAAPWKGTTRMRVVLNRKRATKEAALSRAQGDALELQAELKRLLGKRGDVEKGKSRVVRFDSELQRGDVELQISIRGRNLGLIGKLYEKAQRRAGYLVTQPTYYR